MKNIADMLLQSNMAISTYEYSKSGDCHSTLHSEYGKLLRSGELCATINSGNPNNSDIRVSNSSEQNVCVGDLSGSPLVCDAPEGKVLAGVLVDRTDCAPGAVYTFAGIASALDWLSSRGTTNSPFDHFVLLSDTSTIQEMNTNSSFIMTTTNSIGAISTYELQIHEGSEKTQFDASKQISAVGSNAAVITAKSSFPAETGSGSTAAHFPLMLIVSAFVIFLLVIGLAIDYALSKWCSKSQPTGGVVLQDLF